MLATLRGTVIECLEGKLILEVGAFGIELFVPHSFAPKRGSLVTLNTALYIREENLALYGFPSIEEKQFFLLALTVPGVGPKLGMALLSGMPLSELARQIRDGNAKALEKISGVGKKLAQRLIGDLKGKAAPFVREDAAAEPKSQAVEVLTGLGLDPDEAWRTVESIAGNHSVNEIVDLSLRRLGSAPVKKK